MTRVAPQIDRSADAGRISTERREFAAWKRRLLVRQTGNGSSAAASYVRSSDELFSVLVAPTTIALVLAFALGGSNRLAVGLCAYVAAKAAWAGMGAVAMRRPQLLLTWPAHLAFDIRDTARAVAGVVRSSRFAGATA